MLHPPSPPVAPMGTRTHFRLRIGRVRPRALPVVLGIPPKHLAWWNSDLATHWAELMNLLELELTAPDFVTRRVAASSTAGGTTTGGGSSSSSSSSGGGGRGGGDDNDAVVGCAVQLNYRVVREECTYRVLVPVGEPEAPSDDVLYAGGRFAELPVLGFSLDVVVEPVQ